MLRKPQERAAREWFAKRRAEQAERAYRNFQLWLDQERRKQALEVLRRKSV